MSTLTSLALLLSLLLYVSPAACDNATAIGTFMPAANCTDIIARVGAQTKPQARP